MTKNLKKEQINNIKYFIRWEEAKHKYGDWDKFKITSLRVHSDGYYSFKINWMHTYAGIYEDYYEEGNLFDEFPVYAVLDGLDCVQMLFHKIHRKAYMRKIDYTNKDIKSNDEDLDYLKGLYKPNSYFNKENKTIYDVRYE